MTLNGEKLKQTERLKGWILGLINGIDARMLVNMIKTNKIPTLWEYELPRYLGFVKDLMVEYKAEILEQLTFETVMEYAKEYREDLAKILVHKRAKEWMNRFLNKCRFMFKNIELEPYEIQAKYEKILLERLEKRNKAQAEQVAILLEREQQELELQERLKVEKREDARRKRLKEKERIKHEKKIRDEERRQKKIKRQEERQPKEKTEPQIELIPEKEVEKQLIEQGVGEQSKEVVEQPEMLDAVDKALFKALGKDVSDNKYDFL